MPPADESRMRVAGVSRWFVNAVSPRSVLKLVSQRDELFRRQPLRSTQRVLDAFNYLAGLADAREFGMDRLELGAPVAPGGEPNARRYRHSARRRAVRRRAVLKRRT